MGKGKAGTMAEGLGKWACGLGGYKEESVVESVGFLQVAVEWWAQWPCGTIEESVIWELAYHFSAFSGTAWFCPGFFFFYFNYLPIHYGVSSLIFYWGFYFLIWALSTTHYCLWLGCNNTNKERGRTWLRISRGGLDANSPWMKRMDSSHLLRSLIFLN